MGRLMGVLLALAVCSCAYGAGRDVDVKVIVKKHTGEPVVRLGLGISGIPGSTCANTGADGTVVLRAHVDDGPVKLYVTPTNCGAFGPNDSGDVLDDLEDTTGIQNMYIVNLADQQTAANLDITLPEAIDVSAVIQKSDGEHPDAHILRLDGGDSSKYEHRQDKVILKGVPRARESEIAIMATNGFVQVRTLSASDTASNYDMGSIPVPNPSGVTEVDLTLNPSEAWPTGPGTRAKQVWLMKSDGKLIFYGSPDRSGHVVPGLVGKSGVKPKLPPGEYYMSVGIYWNSWMNTTLWKTLKRADAVALLDVAKWPKITVPEAGSVSAQVIPTDIAKAARAVPTN